MKVSIIILNYKQKELTVNCLKSVLSQDYKDFEIILVDNASQDGSVELFKKEFGPDKKIKIVESKENTGYTGGNNLGYKYANGKYVAVLNNDTIVDKKWLVELIAGLESGENVAMSTSVVINVPSLDNLSPYKKQVEQRKMWTTTLLEYPAVLDKKERFAKTFAVHGGSFIFKRKIVKNLFDPDYFIYAEETKLSWLTRIRGFEIVQCRNSIFYHLTNVVKKSSGKINKHFTFLGERNRILNYFTFYSPQNIIRALPLLIINVIILNIFEIRKLPYRFKSYFWVLFHPGFLSKKRKEVQRQRKVKDKEIIKYMSHKLYQENEKGVSRIILKVINAVFKGYCFLVRLKVIRNGN